MRKPFLMAALLLCCTLFTACSDDDNGTEAYNPSKPAVLTDFYPKEGGVGTRLFITGKNFGKDPSRIHVFMGGNKCSVVGADGDVAYAIVPRRSFDGNIDVKFTGAANDTVQSLSFDSTFTYIPRTTVGTLLRRVDENGNAAYIMGSFDVASVPGNDWMVFDPVAKKSGKRLLFSCDYYNGLRIFDLDNRVVSQPFTREMYNTMMSFTFSADGDTLFFPDDNKDATTTQKPNIYYTLRSEGFRVIRPYNYGPCAMSILSMPDGTKFYTSWTENALYRMENPTGKIPNKDDHRTLVFKLTSLGIDGGHPRMTLHPSGKYMYIYCPERGCIMRSDYDAKRRMFGSPRIVAGRARSSDGCVEGTGDAVRMDGPTGGIFVYNPEYERNPQPDGEKYDFYFAAQWNYCIWKMTPTYVCTVIAGRGNSNVDGQVIGYVDGDPTKEARFARPCGLAYDDVDETFYIGDVDNKSVRYMTTE